MFFFFCSTAPIEGSVDHTQFFDGGATVVESGILLLFLLGVHEFVSDVPLLSVFQCLKFGYKDAYVSCLRSTEQEWDYEKYVGWFLYVHTHGQVLGITAREVTPNKKMRSIVQVKSWVRFVPVMFKTEYRKTREKASHTVSYLPGSLADLPDPADDIPVSEDDSIEEDTS